MYNYDDDEAPESGDSDGDGPIVIDGDDSDGADEGAGSPNED